MKVNKSIIQFRIGTVGSLLATAIAILSQLVSVNELDRYVINATIFLAISIPLLALDVYLLISELIIEKIIKSTLKLVQLLLMSFPVEFKGKSCPRSVLRKI